MYIYIYYRVISIRILRTSSNGDYWDFIGLILFFSWDSVKGDGGISWTKGSNLNSPCELQPRGDVEMDHLRLHIQESQLRVEKTSKEKAHIKLQSGETRPLRSKHPLCWKWSPISNHIPPIPKVFFLPMLWEILAHVHSLAETAIEW